MKTIWLRIRSLTAAFRSWISRISVLSPAHWLWASWAYFIVVILFLAGMGKAFTGIHKPAVFLGALLFFGILPFVSGLGVRLVLKLLGRLPYRWSWVFFGMVFFLMFFLGYQAKTLIVLSAFVLITGAFLGMGLRNLTGGRWLKLDTSRRILTGVFSSLGAALFIFGCWFILYPGKEAPEVERMAMASTYYPPVPVVEDPSLPGTFKVDSLNYGWGGDRRDDFGEGAEILSRTVDGSSFIDGWEKFSGKLRTAYWRMKADSLGLNGRVWYPDGAGPFPLVLMVHGNHNDQDYSDPGYAYLGRHFASRGWIAVSVDENFLNGGWYDFGNKGLKTENDCRGWLLLKHLELWRDWNNSDTAFFSAKVDMDRIVLMGHSRGGEAVAIAAAFNPLSFYPDNASEVFDFDFNIRGVAAIAPVDGQYWPSGKQVPLAGVNYFTLHGSMDGDMRSFDGVRQMRRIQDVQGGGHFGAGLLIHGANHGQFNRSWGERDYGYPRSMFLNRKAIIPASDQEKIALVYLTAFLEECAHPASGYLPLFRDARSGREWLPEVIMLNQFVDPGARVLCDFDEDLDLVTGTSGVDSISCRGLDKWSEYMLPKRWGNQRNCGVHLEWDLEDDSLAAFYRIDLSPGMTDSMGTGDAVLCFLAGDELEREEDSLNYCRFSLRLEIADSLVKSFKTEDYLSLQPKLETQVFKSKLFHKDPGAELMMQYVEIPLRDIDPGQINALVFEFLPGTKGSLWLDRIALAKAP